MDFGDLELHRVMPNESYTKPKLLPKLYHMLWYKSGITQKRHKKIQFHYYWNWIDTDFTGSNDPYQRFPLLLLV